MVVGAYPLEVGAKPVSAVPDTFTFAEFESARQSSMNRGDRKQLGVIEENFPVHVPLAQAKKIVGGIRGHTENKFVMLP